MATLNSLLPALGGLAGLFPTPGTSATQSNSSTQGATSSSLQQLLSSLYNQQGTSNQQQTQGFATQGGTDLAAALAAQGKNLAAPVNLQPYQAQQTEQINANSGATDQAQQAALAARGLSTSPVAGTVAANTQAQRGAQITNLNNSIPVLQQQMQLQNTNAANSILGNQAKTTGTTGSTTASGSTSQTGSTNQSSVTNSNTQANQNTQTQQGGGLGGLFGGLGGVLAGLFG